jgi:hypothetical protein
VRAAAFAAIASLLLGTGCGTVLSFNAEAPNACVTVTGIHVTGADESPITYLSPVPPVTIRQDFVVPVSETGLTLDSSSTLKFVSFTLKPESASYDFGFVTEAQLSAIGATSSLLLGQYQATTGVTATSITMQPSPEPDVTAYVSGGTLELEGALTGTLPAHGFQADATICFDVTFDQFIDPSSTTTP